MYVPDKTFNELDLREEKPEFRNPVIGAGRALKWSKPRRCKMRYLAIFLLFFFGCQWTPTEVEESMPGSLTMELGELPNFISKVSGSLTQNDLTINFEVDDDTTLTFENLNPGRWFLEVSVFDSLDNLTHQGSRFITVLSRQTVTVRILLSAVTGPEGNLLLDVVFNDDRGPIAYYPFNNSGTDLSFYENHAELINVTPITDRHGNGSGALSFNGSTSQVVPADGDVLKTSLPISFSMWLYIIDDNMDRSIYKNGNLELNICKFDTSETGMDQGIGIQVVIGNASVTTIRDVPSFSWCSLVIIIRGSNDVQIFCNQMDQDLQYSGDDVLTYDDEAVVIGANYRGSLDDFRIYNVGLSEDEAMQLMQ